MFDLQLCSNADLNNKDLFISLIILQCVQVELNSIKQLRCINESVSFLRRNNIFSHLDE